MLSTLVRRFPEARLGGVVLRARCYCSVQPPSGKEELDFNNTKEAFRSKSFREVLRHWIVFKMLSFDTLVEHSQGVCNVHVLCVDIGGSWLLLRIEIENTRYLASVSMNRVLTIGSMFCGAKE